MAPIAPYTCTDGEMGALTLESLVEQFQYYKHSSLNKKEENGPADNTSSINLGIIESLAIKGDRFSSTNYRNKRAAVLICLFEGQEGELRVILTKRSMKMFTYPGMRIIIVKSN